jgi:DNA-binding response OmpR family regulator
MRLLLIEDDPHLSELITKVLGAKGFAVDTCELADEACCALKDGIFDVVILDLGLPDQDGMTVLQEMRQGGNATPVLILTSRDGLKDRVNGLNAGADDYVLKPFEMEELIARIKALLRRPGGALGMTLTAGNVVLDSVSREIRIGGEVADLSRRELSVLEHLMRRLEGMVAKELLAESLYGYGEKGSINSVEVSIHRLRKRLADTGATVKINTLRGVGYLLSETAQ